MISLKDFHIFFIAVSILTCAGFGVWSVFDFTISGSVVNLTLGAASGIGGLLLSWYLMKTIARFKRIRDSA